ncbi:DUF748 domain-containing protein [Chryseolinea sp. H1M3-3]|uniref:DUF748 domain-containing protein n=1 Tax=Chryseolinea sp. H1M3-3 TaxID=3034144 RepID=UPI0023EDFA3E|nr:DUF748 domain-containing protein [Chryseolinea sp. H1M3-3]
MKTQSRRFLKWVFIGIAGLTLILLVAGWILSLYASKKIETELYSVGGKFASLQINLFLRRVTLHDVEFSYPPGDTSTNRSKGHIKKLRVSNIGIFKYLSDKHLDIGNISIVDGELTINKNIEFKDSSNASKKTILTGVTLGQVTLQNLKTSVVNDSLPEWSASVNITLKNIESSDTAEISNLMAYAIDDFEAHVSDVVINGGAGLYQTQISAIDVSSGDQTLTVDSLLLIPQHTKYKFAQIAGKQIDRINTFIRKIRVVGFHFDDLRDSAFIASKVYIDSAEILSFRDKRMPFREKENKPLPMEALRNLPFAIEIDTIQVRDAKITYEEFPSEGFKSGTVTFENLNASFSNVVNRSYYNRPAHCTLTASARLMGKGQIEASFILPFDEKKPYHAEGKVHSMDLHHLNQPLENLAFISIETGKLNQINFNFDYTETSSNGRLTINYVDLKINGLKKEKSAVINDLKTLLINTVLKNDKDKSTPVEKRTGTISFERDKKRQIFNYWWKSLFSGIKNSVLDTGK